MGIFKNRKKEKLVPEIMAVPQSFDASGFYKKCNNKNLSISELNLYDSLKSNIPIIDAAIYKTARLIGDCKIISENLKAEEKVNEFLSHIKVNGTSMGLSNFLTPYLEQLITYGTAIGEIVTNGCESIEALYNAPLNNIELHADDNPLDVKIFTRSIHGLKEVSYPGLILLSTLNANPGNITGESILKSLPFVSDILTKIYKTIGTNWERVGNLRFAVTYKPNENQAGNYTKERAKLLASEWKKTMQKGNHNISDFVAVGDVDIKVIGADNQILDSEVPVRQMLEQIISKLSVPPYLLGLSWSTTERMAKEQLDIFTSELQFYRRLLEPVILKICNIYFMLNNIDCKFHIEWDEIKLRDAVEIANAKYINAKAEKLINEV